MALHGTLWDRLGLSGANDNMEAFGSYAPVTEQLVVPQSMPMDQGLLTQSGGAIGSQEYQDAGMALDRQRGMGQAAKEQYPQVKETLDAPERKPMIDAQTMKRVLSGEITLAEAALPGRQLMKTPKVKRVSEMREMRGKPPTEEPSYWDRFKQGASDYFGDEENMANLAMGLNSMRLNPDQQIGAAMGKKAESARARKGRKGSTKAIVQEILIMANQPGISPQEKARLQSLAGIASKGLVDPKEILKQAFKRDTKATNIVTNIEGKTNQMFTKSGIAQAEKLITAGYSADDTLSDLALLRKLGENPILNEVPDMARGFIPTGMSEAVDAYTAVLDRVAKGQRQAGEGVMTEKDFEVLQKTSGDIATSLVSRRIVQTALEEVNKRTAERATYATQYMSQQITLAQFYEKTNALRNRPMFTKEQLKQINSLEGMMGYGILNDNEKNSVSKEQWNKMSMQDREKFINFRSQ